MKQEDNDKRMTRGMVVLYLLLTLGVGIAVIVGIVKIQFVHGDEWRARASKREAGLRIDPARRGNIYSSDGKILATTVTECDLYLDLYNAPLLDDKGNPVYDKKGRPRETGPITDSNFMACLDTVSFMLAQALPAHSVQYYRDRLLKGRQREKSRRCVLIQRGVPYSVWLDISRLPGWRRGVVKQVDGQSVIRQVRAHIYGNLAENTIGFRNSREKNTYTGLEGYYDSILRGQDGIFNCRRLTMGIWLPDEPRERKEIPQRTDGDRVDTLVVQNKVDGQSIVSTIDTRYQDIAESSLRKALRQYGGSAGCAILMEMQTGYVLACANLAVDTSVHDYMEVRDRNVAVSDVYEPGSTFKTVILSAMLEDPANSIDTAMRLPARYKNFGGKNGEIKDDHGNWDSLSLRRVIEQSSNVGMCDLGWQLYSNRRDTLRHLVERMFPYDKLNPDIKTPEYKTHINNLSASNRDFLNFCYGYSTNVSALRLITFYNALGAGGRMVKPLFCRAVIDRNGRQHEVKPVVLNPSICSRRTALLMHDMLENVVENGTGNNIKNNTYGIAGKTGTAVHNYTNFKRYNASFAGFFPSENPRYTCLVVVKDIPAYGRQAATVFKSIADCVVAVDKRLSDGSVKSAWPTLQEDSAKALQRPYTEKGDQQSIERAYRLLRLPYQSADPDSRWVYYQSATDSTPSTYRPYTPPSGQVPNCYGMTAKDGVELLQSVGYKVKVQGYGRVASQSPKGGAAARQGATVVLTMK
ncbi:MAG: transpeptidase family protein [Bacteroidales bacterium]|nr:transpeptidase family protein [Bacteroidales bacterium]